MKTISKLLLLISVFFVTISCKDYKYVQDDVYDNNIDYTYQNQKPNYNNNSNKSRNNIRKPKSPAKSSRGSSTRRK